MELCSDIQSVLSSLPIPLLGFFFINLETMGEVEFYISNHVETILWLIDKTLNSTDLDL